MLSVLDFQQRVLNEELNSIKIKRLKELDGKKDEFELNCMIAESFKKSCEEMKEKGTACEISRAANGLHTRSAELVKTQEQCNRQELHDVEIAFSSAPTALTPMTCASNLIGAIRFKGNFEYYNLWSIFFSILVTLSISKQLKN